MKILKQILDKFDKSKRDTNNSKSDLHLYNTLTKQKEKFVPIKAPIVKVYSCGPTVYNVPHIGNMRSFVFADTLRRVLLYNGYKVKHVINITDVGHLTDDADDGEDKMEKAAKEQKKTAQEIAEEITRIFFKYLNQLNIPLTAYEFPRATQYIDAQISLVKTLEEKGYTYRTSDGIYFDTSKFKEYGKLGGINLEGLKEGARIGKKDEKKNPTDFALWKFSPKDQKRQQEWNSPWGVGFPGWHIECSAMSRELLGQHIDIHTGGIEHIAVHHNNEIAQSECASGEKFVNYWLHIQHLKINGEKMSKSLGNVVTLDDIINKGFNPIALRYLFLTTHYRHELNFTWEALKSAENSLNKLLRFIKNAQKENAESCNTRKLKKYKEEFKMAINDDLATPKALAVMWELVKDESIKDTCKLNTLFKFDEVLGLSLKNLSEHFEEEFNIEELPQDVKELAREREKARQNKNWELADSLRNKIESLGYKVIDSKDGTKYLKNK